MKIIYVAHPYGGEESNKEKVEKYIEKFIKEDENNVYLSPIHATGYQYFWVDYEKGMEYCLEMLSRCDELWLCGDWENSRGCNMEFDFALKNKISVRVV